MIILDKAGYEVNISLNLELYKGKKGLDKFKKDFSNFNLNFEKAYELLIGEMPYESGRDTKKVEENKTSKN